MAIDIVITPSANHSLTVSLALAMGPLSMNI